MRISRVTSCYEFYGSMCFYDYPESRTSTEYNPRAPLEAYNGYPTHGHGFLAYHDETLGAYQNMMPSLVENGLGEPMKELQDEVTKLRAEISRIKETVEQRKANDVGKTEERKLNFRNSYQYVSVYEKYVCMGSSGMYKKESTV